MIMCIISRNLYCVAKEDYKLLSNKSNLEETEVRIFIPQRVEKVIFAKRDSKVLSTFG